jgi:general secretion pathway protein A
MYQEFYGLRERPFDLSSNLTYLLLTPNHQEALSNLEYGIATGNGITLLLGEAGTGKTTVLRKAIKSHMQRAAPHPVRWAYVTNPRLTQAEFFESLAHAFQLDVDAAASKSRFLRELERNLIQHHEKGCLTVLVSDEAQSLPDDLLEEVRLLANIETETEKLLRVVLVGQPALGDRLNDPAFRQLKQRIGLRCVLPPLTLHETAVYIAHRISLAGGDPAQTFSRDAVIAIYERSRGIPRTINVLCENALLNGYAADERPVGAAIIFEVCRDFDLQGGTTLAAVPARRSGDLSPHAVTTEPQQPIEPLRRPATAVAGAARALSYLAPRRR